MLLVELEGTAEDDFEEEDEVEGAGAWFLNGFRRRASTSEFPLDREDVDWCLEGGRDWKSRYLFLSRSMGRALRAMPVRNTLSASVRLSQKVSLL